MGWQQRKIRRSFEQRLRAASDLLDLCKRLRTDASSLGLTAHVAFVNTFQFIVLVYRDLDTIHYENLQPRHAQVHELHMRLWALLLFEYLDDLRCMLGKEFRGTLRSLSLGSLLSDPVGAANGRIRDIAKQHASELNAVRNAVIAHREHDAAAQLDVIRSMSLVRLSGLSRAVMHCSDELYTALTPGIEHVARDLRARLGPNRAMKIEGKGRRGSSPPR